MTKGDLYNLCSKLITEHYKKMDDEVRAFKWLALVPQSGADYESNKNIYQLQDAAIKRMEQEKTELIQLLVKLTQN